jgi:hypothetical protein
MALRWSGRLTPKAFRDIPESLVRCLSLHSNAKSDVGCFKFIPKRCSHPDSKFGSLNTALNGRFAPEPEGGPPFGEAFSLFDTSQHFARSEFRTRRFAGGKAAV